MPPKRMRGKPQPSQSAAPARQASNAAEVEAASQALLQEISWCLERLEAQMKQQNLTSKQVEEARKTWKILANPRTPLVKKRQTMRMVFGDYRATMAQEEKQYSIKPQAMRITNASTLKAPKCKYFKSSSHCPSNVMDATAKDFHFGFSISDEPQPSSTGGSESSHTTAAPVNLSMSKPLENYYRMEASKSHDAPFMFDFSIDESSS